VRTARLRECVDVMRALFAGEEVSHAGHVVVDRARLWTLPETPPPLLCAAVSETTAGWGAEWADGLATVNAPTEHLRRLLDAFGPDGRKVLQVHLSYAPTDEEALRIAHDQWRTNVFDPPICWDLETPEAFDVASALVRPEDVASKVLVSSDLQQHVAWLQEYAALGFDDIALHHVGQDLDGFIDAFGEHVLPVLA
jgi:G6PDH family F420-dependent oxidoreductase